MKTLKETLEEAILALEAAHSGLKWYRDMCPEEVDSSDDEVDFQIESAIKDLEAVVAQQDAQAVVAQQDAQQDIRCECCGYMTHQREHLGCIRAAPASKTAAEIETQAKNVALVAHCGGLIGLSESEALIAIRKLTLPHSDDLWGLSISETQARLKEVLRTLERTKT